MKDPGQLVSLAMHQGDRSLSLEPTEAEIDEQSIQALMALQHENTADGQQSPGLQLYINPEEDDLDRDQRSEKIARTRKGTTNTRSKSNKILNKSTKTASIATRRVNTTGTSTAKKPIKPRSRTPVSQLILRNVQNSEERARAHNTTNNNSSLLLH